MNNYNKVSPHTDQNGHHQKSQERNTGEKRESSYTVGENESWCSNYRKQYRDSLKKRKLVLPDDPPIPLLGVYPEMIKTIIQTDNMHLQ